MAIRAVDSNCRTVLDADQAIDKPTAQAATKQSSSKNDMAFLMLFFRMVRPSQSVVSSDDTTIPFVFGSGAAFLAKVSARNGLPVNDTRTLNGDITLDNRSFGNRSFLQAGGSPRVRNGVARPESEMGWHALSLRRAWSACSASPRPSQSLWACPPNAVKDSGSRIRENSGLFR